MYSQKTLSSRYLSWVYHRPEVDDSKAWRKVFLCVVPVEAVVACAPLVGVVWLYLVADGGSEGPLLVFAIFMSFATPAFAFLELRSKVIRRREIASGALKRVAVTVDSEGVTVGLLPVPWSVSWGDLVVLPEDGNTGFEVRDRGGGSSGRVHVSPFLSTRPFDGRPPDDRSMSALLLGLQGLGPAERDRVLDPTRTQAPYWRYAVDWPVLPGSRDCSGGVGE